MLGVRVHEAGRSSRLTPTKSPLIPMDSEDFFFIFGLSCTCSLLLISAAQIIACPYLIRTNSFHCSHQVGSFLSEILTVNNARDNLYCCCRKDLFPTIYLPYTIIPVAAESTINNIGDRFFFLKCLYPSIKATNMAVIIIA